MEMEIYRELKRRHYEVACLVGTQMLIWIIEPDEPAKELFKKNKFEEVPVTEARTITEKFGLRKNMSRACLYRK